MPIRRKGEKNKEGTRKRQREVVDLPYFVAAMRTGRNLGHCGKNGLFKKAERGGSEGRGESQAESVLGTGSRMEKEEGKEHSYRRFFEEGKLVSKYSNPNRGEMGKGRRAWGLTWWFPPTLNAGHDLK